MTFLRVAILVCLTARFLGAAPKAVLRERPATPEAAARYYIAVMFDSTSPAAITQSTLYIGDSGVIEVTPGMPDAFGSRFTFEVGDQSKLLVSYQSLNLAIHYTDSSGAAVDALMPVSLEVKTEIATNPIDSVCPSGLLLAVGTDFHQPSQGPYVDSRRAALHSYITSHVLSGRIQYQGQEKASTIMGLSLSNYSNLPTQNRYCIHFTSPRPSTFKVELSFPADGPIELRKGVVQKLIKTSKKNAPATMDAGTVGKRTFEQNLDLAIQFSSSVADRKAGTQVVRERTNRGTLDLRLAPLLNLLPNPQAGDRLFTFVTPLYIDGRVSTGKVTESTLAQNRIVYGSDLEFRAYPKNAGSYPTYHRIIGGFRSSNDRDFHQSEYKVIGEYRLVLGPLNKPLAVEVPLRIPWEIGPASDINEIPNERKFGGSILPVVGFEHGHAVRNKFRAAATLPQTSVSRVYFGSSVQLDFTRQVRLSAIDYMYRRFEAESDPWHNYFVTNLDVVLRALNEDSTHSVFASYERGGQPPFNTPDVNSFRVGYRIQMQNWFGKWR